MPARRAVLSMLVAGVIAVPMLLAGEDTPKASDQSTPAADSVAELKERVKILEGRLEVLQRTQTDLVNLLKKQSEEILSLRSRAVNEEKLQLRGLLDGRAAPPKRAPHIINGIPYYIMPLGKTPDGQ